MSWLFFYMVWDAFSITRLSKKKHDAGIVYRKTDPFQSGTGQTVDKTKTTVFFS